MPWSGEFHFGDCWAAYRGPAGHNTPHAHAALQITLAIDGAIAVRDSKGIRHQSRALLIRAGALHTLEPCSDLLVVLCDPSGAAASPLKAHAKEYDVAPLPDELTERLPLGAPLSKLMEAFPPPSRPVDTRLHLAMNFLDEEPGRSISDAAQHCALSPARLRALAANELGVTLGNWRNWRMLRRAGLALAAGENLASSAHAGGFADQAHFSRTMRRMTGLTPSEARAPLRVTSDPFKT